MILGRSVQGECAQFKRSQHKAIDCISRQPGGGECSRRSSLLSFRLVRCRKNQGSLEQVQLRKKRPGETRRLVYLPFAKLRGNNRGWRDRAVDRSAFEQEWRKRERPADKGKT